MVPKETTIKKGQKKKIKKSGSKKTPHTHKKIYLQINQHSLTSNMKLTHTLI